MRKSLLTVALTLFLCRLTGCSRQPDIAGRWETSTSETLCAIFLWLNGDHTCTYLQEGRSLDGTWQLRRNALALTFPTGSVTLTLDRNLPANTLDGWEEYHTGRWSLSGSLLILRCDGQHRNVLTYRLNGDTSRIETDAGIPLKNYMRP